MNLKTQFNDKFYQFKKANLSIHSNLLNHSKILHQQNFRYLEFLYFKKFNKQFLILKI